MAKKHEHLLQKAKNAISELFSDNSVSPLSTRDSLEELRDEIDSLIESLPDPDGDDVNEDNDE